MKYRISWEKNGKRYTITVQTKSEMIAEVADKTTISDRVAVKVIREN